MDSILKEQQRLADVQKENERILAAQKEQQLIEKEEKLAQLQLEKEKKENELREKARQDELAKLAELEAQSAVSFFEKLTQKYSKIYSSKNAAVSGPSSLSADAKLQLRMRLNKRIGQVSPSREQIKSIAADIMALFTQCQSSQEDRLYLMKTLADKVLAQCETQIGAHPPSAFPLAAVLKIIFENNLNISSADKDGCTLLNYFFGKLCVECPLIHFNTKEQIVVDKYTGVIYLFGALLVTSDDLNLGSPFDIPLA